MAIPTTREDFIKNCKRRLGWPVIEINVDEDQVSDRVDEALDYYHQFHNEGTYLEFFRHQVTANDITNQFFTVDENLVGIKRIIPITDKNQIGGMFDIRYQMRLNDFTHFGTSTVMSQYVETQKSLTLMNQVLNGETPIEFNRHMNRVYVFMDWENDVAANDYIVMEGWRALDPDTYTDVYSDRMLQKYATALIKRQWGNNMKKYQGVQLIGGVEMNGQTIYDEADAEVKELEIELRTMYEKPTMFFVG